MAETGKSECADAASSEKLWLRPVEIRDRFKNMGFPLVYRLKSAGDWAQAFAEARDWVKMVRMKRGITRQEKKEREVN